MAPTFISGKKLAGLAIAGKSVSRAYQNGHLIFSKDAPPPPPGPNPPTTPPTHELLISASAGEDRLYYTGGLEIPLYDPEHTVPAVLGNDGERDYLRPGRRPLDGTGDSRYATPGPVSWIGEVPISEIWVQVETTQERIFSNQNEQRIEVEMAGFNFFADAMKPSSTLEEPGVRTWPVGAVAHSGLNAEIFTARYESRGAGESTRTLTFHLRSWGGATIWLDNTMVAHTTQGFQMQGNTLNAHVFMNAADYLNNDEMPRLYSHKIWVIPAP